MNESKKMIVFALENGTKLLFVAYRSALNSLPKRPTQARPDTSEVDETLGEDASAKYERKASDDEAEREPVVDVPSPAVAESEKESVRLRSVLNANIGAITWSSSRKFNFIAVCNKDGDAAFLGPNQKFENPSR